MKTLVSEQNNLNKLLNELFTRCKQLLELSKKQKEAIQSDDPKIIKEILHEKEKIIEEFKNIQKYYQQSENLSLKINHSPRLNDLIEKIDAVLEELHLIEEECEETLSRRCTEIKEEINQIKKSRTVLNKFSFRSKKPQSSSLIDEKA